MFFGAGLILVAVGAVTVLVFAPKADPPKKGEPATSAEHDADQAMSQSNAAAEPPV
jgi:hypothetical protein